MSRRTIRTAAMLIILTVATCSTAQAQIKPFLDPNQAVAVARRTGKPILAVAGTTECVYCKRILNQLASNQDVQPIAPQLVVLLLDVSTPAWNVWDRRHEMAGNGVPKVYFIRADGKQLYGRTGAPSDLASFLTRQLQAAGNIPSERELQAMRQAVQKSRQARNRNNASMAVQIVAEMASSETYAASALTLNQIRGELIEEGDQKLQKALKLLDEDSKVFEGALLFVEVYNTYKPLPELNEKLESTQALRRNDSKTAKMLDRAAAIFQARQLAAQRKWAEALAAYEQILRDSPDTQAAELAKVELPSLRKRVDTMNSPTSAAARSSDASRSKQRAESYLRIGKLLHGKKNERAREYLQKAIEAAPQTKIAAEAKRLLGEL